MAAFPRAYRSSATHRNGGTAGHRRATPSQTTGRTYSDVGTGIHNAKVEGIKEGGELPRLCNFIAESAIRFLSKLSCRWRRSYRAAHQNCFPSECSMPQRVGDWGNGFMPCGEDEGESALASYRCAEAVFPVAGMVRRIPYTKGGLSMVRSLARRLPA